MQSLIRSGEKYKRGFRVLLGFLLQSLREKLGIHPNRGLKSRFGPKEGIGFGKTILDVRFVQIHQESKKNNEEQRNVSISNKKWVRESGLRLEKSLTKVIYELKPNPYSISKKKRKPQLTNLLNKMKITNSNNSQYKNSCLELTSSFNDWELELGWFQNYCKICKFFHKQKDPIELTQFQIEINENMESVRSTYQYADIKVDESIHDFQMQPWKKLGNERVNGIYFAVFVCITVLYSTIEV